MSAPAPNFLNVAASLRGQVWRDRLDAAGQARALAITQVCGVPDIMARIIAGRGVAPEDVERWLNPTLRDLMPDPDAVRDMSAAATRLADAVTRGEMIGIFGDYDVDGATSSALLAGFLESAGCPYLIHIPDRIFEGYGPNSEAVRALQDAGAKLLVTVDCGTTSAEVIALARKNGLETIVIDHHQAPEKLPEALAIVNPNRQDDLSGLGTLCAAGVVFMVLVALNRILRARGFWSVARPAPELKNELDLVALGTVADVVPLTGLNRAFVMRGLEVMRARARPGLRALMDAAGASGEPSPYHLGFLVGPRINAGGRIGDAALGAKLLLMRYEAQAAALAAELDRLNRERQSIERGIVEIAEAEALAALGLEEKGAVVVVAGDGWHPGVVGLVAARLKERFRRPAFAIAFRDDVGTGSGRSIPGVDLGRVVRAGVEAGLLVKGGGHAMAAGLTIARGNLGALRAYFEAELGPAVERARADESLKIDAAVSAAGATAELIADMAQAGPFGSGNPEPVVAIPNVRLVDVGQVGADHLRLRAVAGDGARIEAIAFRAAGGPLGQGLVKARGGRVHLAGTLSINHYGGRERVQMRVIDAAVVQEGAIGNRQ